MHSVEITKGTETIIIETGAVARQANGAVVVRHRDTVLLVTAVAAEEPRAGIDFFPLTVEYREKTGAAGRIPGGYLKRENRPGDHEVLGSRLVDRAVRPLFPDGFTNEVQVIATVLSVDPEGDPEMLAMLGASAAVHISDIPWSGPVAGVRVARVNGELVAFPTWNQRGESDLDLFVAVGPGGLGMVEGQGHEVPDEVIVEALMFAQEAARPLLAAQVELRNLAGRDKWDVPVAVIDGESARMVAAAVGDDLAAALRIPEKKARYKAIRELKKRALEQVGNDEPERGPEIAAHFDELHHAMVRRAVLDHGRRIDGRDLETVRPVTIETSWLPRAHGSALFTRGETQAMVSCTLGTGDDEQRIETLRGEVRERFLLHYNFPPYSVGEIKPIRGPGRREIGHGTLARRALTAILPSPEAFPYTIRLVSDISESNGSSSMATVCGGCLALMDAGVPITRPAAGVAMGLIAEGDTIRVLTDILGDEDHLGDMDFKVTGTARGITAMQMDNKVGSLSRDVLVKALQQARRGLDSLLDTMASHLPAPRPQLSVHAPRILQHLIRPQVIRELIGPGGKVIQEIQAMTNTKIEIADDGTVKIYSTDEPSAARALSRVKYFTDEPQLDKVYRGTVTGVKDFGAFVRINGGNEGLVHISELEDRRVNSVRDILNEGDTVMVRVIGVENGKLKLSRRAALHADRSDVIEY
ncbi:polyribonucleotide nucleotidyltransferase [bacterium]|nr:polyribonucleotide nucleotidyltransferase [candidate division CSSED10-310 bacterium]